MTLFGQTLRQAQDKLGRLPRTKFEIATSRQVGSRNDIYSLVVVFLIPQQAVGDPANKNWDSQGQIFCLFRQRTVDTETFV